LPPQARGTAMVFQNYALWPHMSVFDNVAYGLRRKRLPSDAIRSRVLAALDLVEIGDAAGIAQRKPGALSGGQQQRVALARALVRPLARSRARARDGHKPQGCPRGEPLPGRALPPLRAGG